MGYIHWKTKDLVIALVIYIYICIYNTYRYLLFGVAKKPSDEHLLAGPEKSFGNLGRRVRLGALWCMLRWEQCLVCVADGWTEW